MILCVCAVYDTYLLRQLSENFTNFTKGNETDKPFIWLLFAHAEVIKNQKSPTFSLSARKFLKLLPLVHARGYKTMGATLKLTN